jgi:hypothetical protein
VRDALTPTPGELYRDHISPTDHCSGDGSIAGGARGQECDSVAGPGPVKELGKMKNQSNVWEDASITLAEDIESVVEAIFDDLDGARFQCKSESGIDVMAHDPVKPTAPAGVLGILLDDELCVIEIVRRSPADDCREINVGDKLASVDGIPIKPNTHTKEQV